MGKEEGRGREEEEEEEGGGGWGREEEEEEEEEGGGLPDDIASFGVSITTLLHPLYDDDDGLCIHFLFLSMPPFPSVYNYYHHNYYYYHYHYHYYYYYYYYYYQTGSSLYHALSWTIVQTGSRSFLQVMMNP